MNILEQIYQDKLIEVVNKKRQISQQEILQQVLKKIHQQNQINNKSFVDAINRKVSKQQIAIIAEVKKASPSKGIIRENFDPLEIAKIYQANKAACISVLTDEKYFQGKNQYLIEIAANTNLPILRKDFIIDQYQILESKLIGANCILLIMAMLSENQAIELEQAAIEVGLEVLIEVHDEEELKKALKLKSSLIGINNRNLKTFEISLQNCIRLAPQVPNDRIIICESGIFNQQDIALMQKIGVNSFLVGESLMKQNDIGLALNNLLKVSL